MAVGGLVVGVVLVRATGDAGWLLLAAAGLAAQPLILPLVVWMSRQPRMFTELPELQEADG